jgi:metal-sulfur cluster biosynthetic enzyme
MKKTKKPKFDSSSPYYKILNSVTDPEVNIGIADMGLIYGVVKDKATVLVTMTLTSMGCPAGPMLTEQIENALMKDKKIKDVQIEIVWDPPWTMERMKPEIRQMLFGK